MIFEIDHYETKVTSPGGTFSEYKVTYCEEDAVEIGEKFLAENPGWRVTAIYRIEKAKSE